MESKIQLLSDNVINQIAAGEVIENPSSVVKELIENSLDAGATQIVVEILVGGRQMIRVSDNGSGMTAAEARLCLERHATSKIRTIEDLQLLATMGFRGEAIASIASISKFSLLTAPKGGGEATLITAEGGKVVSCGPSARSPGTTIEVKSLFFNVPVRKKFQRSPAYDAGEIYRVVSTLALGNPHCKFQLLRDRENILLLPVLSEMERMRQVLGEELLDNALQISGEKEGYTVSGWVGKPSYTRHNRSAQYLFVNRRPLVAPLVGRAVREGYGTTVGILRHPVFVLHLQLPSAAVDVNVHPQKREARFRDENLLMEMITTAVSQGLRPKENVKVAFRPPQYFAHVREAPPPLTLPEKEDEIPSEPPPLPLPQRERSCPAVLGTIPGYILLEPDTYEEEGKRGLYFVDQRRAHHRILFERLTKGEALESGQPLLLPYTIDYPPQDAAIIREGLPILQQMGFSVKEFGKETFQVEAIPVGCEEGQLHSTLLRIAEEGRNTNCEKEKKLLRISSYGALSRSVRLTNYEALRFLRDLFACELPQICPHGKPIIICLEEEKIAAL